jgi:very-long-chain enoyl-CoA reductase
MIVAFYGQTKYLNYLAAVWAFSDFIRYSYHLFPSNKILKYIRYSQYKILYPTGVGLELATLLPVLSPYYQIGVSLLYVIVFPYMFNHTSKMESKVWLLEKLAKYNQSDGSVTIDYNKKMYTISQTSLKSLVYNLSPGSRYRLQAVADKDDKYILKDYGIQISWRLVYLIEYFGALIAFPYLVGDLTRIDTILWIAHYSKRLFESAFIHKFSNDTMPFTNVFKNSAYYWGAGLLIGYYAKDTEVTNYNMFVVGAWIVCQLGNGYCHYYLANLRPPGTKEHVLPTGALFRLVTCPNYTFEILGWALFACLTTEYNMYFAVKALFCLVGAGQMYVWAKGKRRRYKKLFDDKYKVTGVLLPGV